MTPCLVSKCWKPFVPYLPYHPSKAIRKCLTSPVEFCQSVGSAARDESVSKSVMVPSSRDSASDVPAVEGLFFGSDALGGPVSC